MEQGRSALSTREQTLNTKGMFMKNFIITLCTILTFNVSILFAEQVQISQIMVDRHGDNSPTFSLLFMVGSNNLRVDSIPNKTPKADILGLVKLEIIRWKDQQAESNIQDIISTYEGKTVTINVP